MWYKNSIILLSGAERQGISVVPLSPLHERPSMEEEGQGGVEGGAGVQGRKGEGTALPSGLTEKGKAGVNFGSV